MILGQLGHLKKKGIPRSQEKNKKIKKCWWYTNIFTCPNRPNALASIIAIVHVTTIMAPGATTRTERKVKHSQRKIQKMNIDRKHDTDILLAFDNCKTCNLTKLSEFIN